MLSFVKQSRQALRWSPQGRKALHCLQGQEVRKGSRSTSIQGFQDQVYPQISVDSVDHSGKVNFERPLSRQLEHHQSAENERCRKQGYAVGNHGPGMFWEESVVYGSGDFDAGQVDPLRRARVGSVCVAKNDVYGNELCLIDETITRLGIASGSRAGSLALLRERDEWRDVVRVASFRGSAVHLLSSLHCLRILLLFPAMRLGYDS